MSIVGDYDQDGLSSITFDVFTAESFSGDFDQYTLAAVDSCAALQR
jgi:hypothetical protein